MTEELNGGCLDERAIRDALVAMLAAHGAANDGRDGASIRVTQDQIDACRQARKALSTSKQAGAEPVGEDLKGVWLTAPGRIWLDLGEPDMREMDAYTVANFRDLGEVTWSEDNASGWGIPYVRADSPKAAVMPAAPSDAVELDRQKVDGKLSYTLRDDAGDVRIGNFPITAAQFNAIASILEAAPGAAIAAREQEGKRTPQDYAIEHAEYMATTAEGLIEAVNDLAKAEQERDDGSANPSDVEAAQETVSEYLGTLRNRIYEFRKRKDRAALTQPTAVQQADINYALKWCTAALKAVAPDVRGTVRMFVAGESKTLDEALELAEAALKTAQTTAEPGGNGEGGVLIAALYVETDGGYFGVPGVEPWDEARDARKYTGPLPVVAHPPCQRWGRYFHGAPNKPNQYRLGEDQGCFAAALTAVRNYGGVLEHPAHSRAWEFFGLNTPPASGGWVKADNRGGYTCHVEQGHYGHMSRKATWLYACGTDRPELKWGPSEQRIHPRALELHGYEKARRIGMMAMVGGKDKTRIRNATPPEFRDVLMAIARSAAPAQNNLELEAA